MEGLPPYITYEMVEEAIRCQEEFGHPAGCTIAQIICESGQGETMSQLATRDHNLFGMKWASSFASAPEVVGKAGWTTQEEYTPGTFTTITAYFTVFKGDVECIRFRSRVFLQASHYSANALIQQAIAERSSDKMAEGLKDAGWATSSAYVDSLKSAMDTYNLRRFDSMTVEDFERGALSADAVIAAAYSQLGVPYVWGGTTPGVGLDCSGLPNTATGRRALPSHETLRIRQRSVARCRCQRHRPATSSGGPGTWPSTSGTTATSTSRTRVRPARLQAAHRTS